MSMPISAMRTMLKRQYRSEKWNKKVDRMKDAQVATIYLRMKYQTNNRL